MQYNPNLCWYFCWGCSVLDLHLLLSVLAGNWDSFFLPGIYLIILFQDTLPQFLYNKDQMLKDDCIPHVKIHMFLDTDVFF